jgi:hypothetical protein
VGLVAGLDALERTKISNHNTSLSPACSLITISTSFSRLIRKQRKKLNNCKISKPSENPEHQCLIFLYSFFIPNILLSAQYVAKHAGAARRKECKASCVIYCIVVDFNQNSIVSKRYGVTLRCQVLWKCLHRFSGC